jgi:hypothetical protein
VFLKEQTRDNGVRWASGIGWMDQKLQSTEQSTHGPDRQRLLFDPNVRIHGLIDDRVVLNFLDDLKAARNLIKGSEMSLHELREHAMNSCYLKAAKAVELEIVEDIAH